MESSDRFARARARISLEQCRKQAKELVKGFKRGDERALRTVRANHPRFRAATHAEFLQQPFALADAQLVIARMQHIESWPKLDKSEVASRLIARFARMLAEKSA